MKSTLTWRLRKNLNQHFIFFDCCCFVQIIADLYFIFSYCCTLCGSLLTGVWRNRCLLGMLLFCADHCFFVFYILRLLYFAQIIVDRGVKDGLQALLVLSVHSHLDVSGREHWAEPSQWQRTTTLKDRLRWSLRLCFIF